MSNNESKSTAREVIGGFVVGSLLIDGFISCGYIVGRFYQPWYAKYTSANAAISGPIDQTLAGLSNILFVLSIIVAFIFISLLATALGQLVIWVAKNKLVNNE